MRWKRAIRPAVDRAAAVSGLLRLSERRMRSGITILMYHRVLPGAECEGYRFPSLVMPKSLFEAQLDHLQGWACVALLGDVLDSEVASPLDERPIVCLTFDDGYADNYDIVAPLLEARGMRGTFFITAGAVEAGAPLWYDVAAEAWAALGPSRALGLAGEAGATPAEQPATSEAWIEWLKRLPHRSRAGVSSRLSVALGAMPSPLMTPECVRALADRGHEIGSHTLTHPILTTMTDEERNDEIRGAMQLLGRWTGRAVAGFCYPNGDFDEGVIDQLREAGHRYACTTLPGRNDAHTDPFGLRRIDVTADRVTDSRGRFDSLAFRAEISCLRDTIRGRLRSSP